jgi:hypothetical protein
MGMIERMTAPVLDRLATALAARRPRPDLDEERGASGTPNFGGFISGEDYNPKLDGKAAMAVYDEMRRSDAQVQAALLVVKFPLRSADWRIDGPKDGTPDEQAIADWCQETLLAPTWNDVLRHLLLKLDFGVSVLEKVWALGPDGRLRPKKLAPRLPHTIEEWVEDPETGELATVVQQAWKGGALKRLAIPASSCIISVHDREGDNWYGRGLLRSAYAHWFWKTQLYRIDAVKHDRWGVGIPEAVLDKDQTFSTEELTAIDRVLQGLRAHEKGYLRHSSKWELKIRTPESAAGGTSDLMTSVEHHNSMIARAVLAGFLSQGEQPHGSFGLGARMTDFFSNALEAVADDLCSDLNAQLVRPLCDYNFVMGGKRYPQLTVSNLSDVDMKELAAALQTLGKHITPDDDLEDVLRTMMNMPPLPKTLRGRREAAPATPPPPFGGPGGEPPGPTPGEPGASKKAGSPPASAALRINAAAFLRLAGGAQYVNATGHVLGRAPTPFELAVLALHEIPSHLDRAAEQLAQEIAVVRRAQLDAILDEIVRKDARDETGAFTDIRPANIALPKARDLERAIKQTQANVAAYGALQVQGEARRQGVLIPPGSKATDLFLDASQYETLAAQVFAQPAVDGGKGVARSALVTSAKITAERLSDAWYGRILDVALGERRTGKQGDDLRQAVQQRLFEEVEKPPVGEARAEVNEAFAVGRAVEAQTVADQIETVEYSALMDENTCSSCSALDGEQFPFGSARYYETLPPYTGCLGNRGRQDACRCAHLYHFSDATV